MKTLDPQPDGGKSHWWGRYTLDEDTAGLWKIGPLTLQVYRTTREWRTVFERGRDPLELDWSVEIPAVPIAPSSHAVVNRYGFSRTTDAVSLMPALADRRVVITPDSPLHVPGGERVTLYVSTPLWVQIWAGEPRGLLQDEPIFRPSDTWFGPSTREGEICYASWTRGHLDLDVLIPRPQRAFSAVLIRNEGLSTLHVDRLNLPMPHLGLFAGGDGNLWTEGMELVREGDSFHAQVALTGRPPEGIPRATLLTPARVKPEKKLLIRAFGELFG